MNLEALFNAVIVKPLEVEEETYGVNRLSQILAKTKMSMV